jgi:arylsulfatase A-like enzyme
MKNTPKTFSPPNIVFLMSDDHAAHAMSCYHRGLIETPNLDRIAREGALLPNCFCTNSICTPSRASILTGQYPHKNGAITFNAYDANCITFPQLFRRNGYHTAMIGKWHLQCEPVGFDSWCVLPGQGVYRDPIFIENGREIRKQGYLTDIITDLTIEAIEKIPEGQPFCICSHHKAPHDPFIPADRHAGLFADMEIPEPENLFDDFATRSEVLHQSEQRIGSGYTAYPEETGHITDPVERKKAQYQTYIKQYLRTVTAIEENTGRLLEFLDEKGLTDNTIVIYTSDQGFFLGEHGWYDKRFMYEESLRMPFLIRYPREIPAGSTPGDLMLNIDVAPTLLEFAGLEVPEEMQGSSFAPQLRGESVAGWRDGIYYRYYLSHFNTPPHWGIRTQDHKLIYYHDSEEWELYDLRADPMEMNNLYGHPEHQERIRQLKQRIVELREEFGDVESAEEGNARAAKHLGRKTRLS